MTTTFDELELGHIVNDRILARIDKIPSSNDVRGECWIFKGYKDKGGYGRLNVRKRKECYDKNFYTHRLTYVYFKGGIEDNIEIDHKCKNRACCNPEHLEAVTRKVNMERRWGTKAPEGIQVEIF